MGAVSYNVVQNQPQRATAFVRQLEVWRALWYYQAFWTCKLLARDGLHHGHFQSRLGAAGGFYMGEPVKGFVNDVPDPGFWY